MGQFEQAHNLFSGAGKDDRLNAAALSLNGRVYLRRFYNAPQKQTALLLWAEKNLLAAIERNEADFKNFERLAEVYSLLAKTAKLQRKGYWLNIAFDRAWLAVQRYPGCGRLRVELGKIAEQLGEADFAIENYKEAIEIEDKYRRQFRLMYPGEKLFSRLGEEKYQLVKERVKILSREPL